MDNIPSESAQTPLGSTPESPENRANRIERERALIAAAEAEFEAGLGIDEADFEAWLDALEIDPNAPMPGPRPPTP